MTNDLDEERLGYHGPKDRDRLRKSAAKVGADNIDYSGQTAEQAAKSLAIALAVKELEKLTARDLGHAHPYVTEVIANLLIGLGCEAVVKAWDGVK